MGQTDAFPADIALLKNESPVWLLEAKKYGQRLHPDLVSAYLTKGVMGVVSDGSYWIFCVSDQTLTIGPLVTATGEIDHRVFDRLVGILIAATEDEAFARADGWTTDWQPIARSPGPTIWRLNAGTGSRLFVEKQNFSRLQDAVATAQTFAQADSIVGFFLEELSQTGQEIEVSTERLIWWLPDGRRGARINLKGRQLEILILNAIIDRLGRERILASLKLHDKNHAMSVCKATTLAEIRSIVPIFSLTP